MRVAEQSPQFLHAPLEQPRDGHLRSAKMFRQLIERLQIQASPELDARVQRAIRQAEPSEAPPSASNEPSLLALLTLIMKKKSVRYTLGTTVALAVIAGVILNQATTTAWAMEQAIQALQKYKAVRLTGYTTAGGGPAPTEIWARANAAGTRSRKSSFGRLGNQ